MSKKVEKVEKVCACCGKTFYVRPCEAKRYNICSLECKRAHKKTYDRVCLWCGKHFTVFDNNKHANFCSRLCRGHYRAKRELRICKFCGKEFETIKSNNSSFCSDSCKKNWHSEVGIKTLNCPTCGKEIRIKSARVRHSKKQYCSVACARASLRTAQEYTCDFCGKSFTRVPSRNKGTHKFCSNACTQNFYLIEENRTEKQKESARMLTDSRHPLLTIPHKAVDEMLELIGVEYENEFKTHYYLLDIYMPEYSLAIEVNGDFWHANPLIYNTINYIQQKDAIKNDKKKHSYVKNQYGFEVLYIWEKDIKNNQALCQRLIEKYLENDGRLDNYHSFNYHLEDDDVVLNENIIIPYADREKKDIVYGGRLLENKKAS